MACRSRTCRWPPAIRRFESPTGRHRPWDERTLQTKTKSGTLRGTELSNFHPSVVILAGPNGAGKSTAAPALLHGTLAVSEFVNADVIARGLSAADPDRAAIAAGRVMLMRLREL